MTWSEWFGVGIIAFTAAIWAAVIVALIIRDEAIKTRDAVSWEARTTRHYIKLKQEATVSELSDKIAEVAQSVSDLEASDAASTQAVTDAIARLEAKIAAGGASPADIAALDSLKARVAALKGVEDAQKAQADAEPV